MAQAFDAVVIGGGPGGATAATLLAQAGWSVVLLERKEFPRRKVCGEYLSATNWPLLDALGVTERFRQLAGPSVRRVGLFVGTCALHARLPRPSGPEPSWGRALSREQLDTLLVQRAAELGADVRQPWSAVSLDETSDGFICRAESLNSGEVVELFAPVVIAAHGSWEPGSLPTQSTRRSHRPSDLLGFKAHFRDCDLSPDLMPLVSFAGGYGGMVHCDGGRVSFSCCIRRDRLERVRHSSSTPAGEVVFEHVLATCSVLQTVLRSAVRDGPWLSAGPIRSGMRLRYRDGVFVVGNAAGEAHPVVAEGISMAMQSAWLLAERLLPRRAAIRSRAARDAIGRDYARIWRRSFLPRIQTASAVAHWAMRRAAVRSTLPLIRRFPEILTLGARLSGKAMQLVIGST